MIRPIELKSQIAVLIRFTLDNDQMQIENVSDRIANYSPVILKPAKILMQMIVSSGIRRVLQDLDGWGSKVLKQSINIYSLNSIY